MLVLSTGIAVATGAIPDSDDGQIHGCYLTGVGQVRVVDHQAGERCKKNEVAISWNEKGVKGDAGPRGLPGPQGPKGETGPAGPKGETGPAGPKGATGPKGDTGPAGAKGETGPAGPKGETGPAGPKGETGAKGEVGPAGPKGEVGPAGPKGDKGDAGPIGPIGPAGPAGPKGDKGDPGVQGPRGFTGAKGDKGDTGPSGAIGPAGPAGPKGDTGAQGPQGAQGPRGFTGLKGDKGDTGAAGADGISFIWQHTWSPLSIYVPNEVVFHEGSSYIAVNASAGVTPGDPGQSSWELMAQKGDKGAQGPQGVQGPRGFKGDTGLTGPAGPAGPAGAAGAAGAAGDDGTSFVWRDVWAADVAYKVNDVVHRNGAAYIAVQDNVGKDPASALAEWDLMVKRGLQGVKGDPGPAGPKGDTGPAGAAGPAGPAGPAGQTGPAGPAGKDGSALGYAFIDFDDQDAPFFNPDQSKGVVGVARGFNGDPMQGYVCFDLSFSPQNATATPLYVDEFSGFTSVAIGMAPNADMSSCPEGFRDAFAAAFNDGPRDEPFYITFN